MSAAKQRKYVQVMKCEYFTGPHEHIETEDNIYCHGIGGWLKQSTFLTPKELKEKWKAKPKE